MIQINSSILSKFIYILIIIIHINIYTSTAYSTPTLQEEILQVRKDDKILGCKNAPNTMIEYSSLTCAHCVNFHDKFFMKIKSEYIDQCKLIYIYRDFPTSASSLFASSIAHCSDNYYDWLNILMHTHKEWSTNKNYQKVLLNIAQLNGMSSEKFNQCIANKEISKFISLRAYEAVRLLQINHTPSIFINGKILQGKIEYKDIINALK